MDITLRSENIEVTISTEGGEIVHLINKENYDYIWQKDDVYFKNSCPILFPILGRIENDRYLYEDKQYCLTSHGFLRNSEFELKYESQHSCVLSFSDNEETLKVYPFHFKVLVFCYLEEKKVHVKTTIINNDEKGLPFMLGFHPAFNLNLSEPATVSFPVKDFNKRISRMLNFKIYPFLNGNTKKGQIFYSL